MDFVNLFDWMKCKEKLEEKEKVQSFVIENLEKTDEEDKEEYKPYIVVITQYFNEPSQQLMKVYCNDIEAYNLFQYLNQKILELTSKEYVNIAMACRNEQGEIIQNGISHVVGISHNIPCTIKGETEAEINEKEVELSLKK